MAAPCSLDSSVGDGDFSTVKLLLESGVDANTRTRDGMTPLAVSAFWGYDTIVQLLLQYGADINAANCGTLWTPLHCAAFQGHGKVIMILMEHGPELSKKEIQGRDPGRTLNLKNWTCWTFQGLTLAIVWDAVQKTETNMHCLYHQRVMSLLQMMMAESMPIATGG